VRQAKRRKAIDRTWGSGRDGRVRLDGVRRYPFATLDLGDYRLLRSVEAKRMHLMAGIRLFSNGFMLWCTGTAQIDGVFANDP